MSRIPTFFNFGNKVTDFDDLLRQLDIMYTTLARSINLESPADGSFTYNVSRTYSIASAPSASADINKEFEVGDFWNDTSVPKVYMLTNRTSQTAVTWTALN